MSASSHSSRWLLVLLLSLAAQAKATDPALFDATKRNDMSALQAGAEEHPAWIAQRSDKGVSLLLFAAYNERPDMVAYLRGKQRDLSFHEACVVGDLPTVKRYLARGLDLNKRSQDGFTPLGLSVLFRQPDVAKLLIDAGADLDAKASNTLQVAPIHAAVARSDLSTLQLLLESGASPDLTQQRLMRPLHEASAAGNMPIVATLLLFGADARARNEEGKTPSDFAREAGHPALAARLAALVDRPRLESEAN